MVKKLFIYLQFLTSLYMYIGNKTSSVRSPGSLCLIFIIFRVMYNNIRLFRTFKSKDKTYQKEDHLVLLMKEASYTKILKKGIRSVKF